MSGHSKWSQIKRKKAVTDAKKGQMFSKLARIITIAAREKGGDSDSNPTLRLAIEKAKSFNMPQDNIEKAIKRGTGEIAGAKIEGCSYEAYGPGGVALIIEGSTDNKNRTFNEIRLILKKYGGKIAESGSVSYLFRRSGIISVDLTAQVDLRSDLEKLEEIVIESGADDFEIIDSEEGRYLEIYTQPSDLDRIKKFLEENGVRIDSFSLGWIPQNEIKTIQTNELERIEKLIDELTNHQDVNDVYSNLQLSKAMS